MSDSIQLSPGTDCQLSKYGNIAHLTYAVSLPTQKQQDTLWRVKRDVAVQPEDNYSLEACILQNTDVPTLLYDLYNYQHLPDCMNVSSMKHPPACPALSASDHHSELPLLPVLPRLS